MSTGEKTDVLCEAFEPGFPVAQARFVSLGEGYWGDYDPKDPNDKSLWRLDIQYSEDPSDMDTTCTILPVDTPEEEVRQILGIVAGYVRDAHQVGFPFRELLKWLSYIAPGWRGDPDLDRILGLYARLPEGNRMQRRDKQGEQ